VFGLVFGQGWFSASFWDVLFAAVIRSSIEFAEEHIKIYMCHRFLMFKFSLCTNTFISTQCHVIPEAEAAVIQ